MTNKVSGKPYRVHDEGKHEESPDRVWRPPRFRYLGTTDTRCKIVREEESCCFVGPS